jgi:hypothetical protein
MTVTATKIDSLHENGKNFITWAWPASTTIIYNNHVKSMYVPILSISRNLSFLRRKCLKTFY